MKQRIDRIVRSLHSHRKNTGLVVGVIQRDHCSIFGYGNVSDAGPEPPCGDTLFEIGSITKVFTATLLSTIVADGLLNLGMMLYQEQILKVAMAMAGFSAGEADALRRAMQRPEAPPGWRHRARGRPAGDSPAAQHRQGDGLREPGG